MTWTALAILAMFITVVTAMDEDGTQKSLGKSHGKLEDAFVRSKKCTTGTKYMPGNMQRLDKGGVFGQKSASGSA